MKLYKITQYLNDCLKIFFVTNNNFTNYLLFKKYLIYYKKISTISLFLK